MLAGIDVGRFMVKVYHAGGKFDFYSSLGEYREFEFADEIGKGKDDMVVEHKGTKLTAGTLARRESEFGGSMMTESKLHQDTVILTLIAIHKLFDSGDVKIVTNLPIADHSRDKQALKSLLNGAHYIAINGIKKHFNVTCEIAAEGSGIYKFADRGIVRGLNVGSRTINAISFLDGVKVGRESDTFDFGMESVKNKDTLAMARAITSKTAALKWRTDDSLVLIGGGAPELYQDLHKYYPNVRMPINPSFVDAEAFYNIARDIYGKVLS